MPSIRSVRGLFVAALGALMLMSGNVQAADPVRVYIGTYTEGTKSKGIYTLTFDPETGTLSQPEVAAEAVNPSFVALHPAERMLYAVNEVDELDGQPEGGVSAFSIDSDGSLKFVNRVPSKGKAPCHLSVEPSGERVWVANYNSGTLAVIRLHMKHALSLPAFVYEPKGSSINAERQQGPHAHCIRFDPSGHFAVEGDLGLDNVHVFANEPEIRAPKVVKIKPGSGPRHVAFGHDGKTLYALNELGLTVTVFRFDPASGQTEELQMISTLPEGADRRGASTAEVVVHPSGKFLYNSNRGHDSIAIFSIDPATGKLTAVGHEPTQGKTPRNFNIDPTGKFLIAANQDSNTLVVFEIDQETGKLKATGQKVEVPAPVCVVFDRK